MDNLITRDNLIKILESAVMIDQLYNELKKNEDVNRAVWYTLRDYPTHMALLQSEGNSDWNPFEKNGPGTV